MQPRFSASASDALLLSVEVCYTEQLTEQSGRVTFMVTWGCRGDGAIQLKTALYSAEPLGNKADAIANGLTLSDVLRVDSFTLLALNLSESVQDDQVVERQAAASVDPTREKCCKILSILNEVGLGVVRDRSTARRLRDLLGKVNNFAAAMIDTVTLTVVDLLLSSNGGTL